MFIRILFIRMKKFNIQRTARTRNYKRRYTFNLVCSLIIWWGKSIMLIVVERMSQSCSLHIHSKEWICLLGSFLSYQFLQNKEFSSILTITFSSGIVEEFDPNPGSFIYFSVTILYAPSGAAVTNQDDPQVSLSYSYTLTHKLIKYIT